MGGLREKLTSAGVVGLDTSIFIYQLEANPTYATLTKTVFENMEGGQISGSYFHNHFDGIDRPALAHGA